MYYLGVDVGGTNIAVGVVDENNAIIAKASQKTPVPCSEEVFCDKIVEVCSEALGKANLTFDDVPWIGIGCPGTVNRATGIIEFANNLYFKNFKLREMMAERTNGKLVILENDANAAAYGEYQARAPAGAGNAVAVASTRDDRRAVVAVFRVNERHVVLLPAQQRINRLPVRRRFWRGHQRRRVEACDLAAGRKGGQEREPREQGRYSFEHPPHRRHLPLRISERPYKAILE